MKLASAFGNRCCLSTVANLGEDSMSEALEGQLSANISRYLAGIQFPASKNDTIHALRRNGASNEVVARMTEIPQTQFTDLNDLIRAYQGNSPLA